MKRAQIKTPFTQVDNVNQPLLPLEHTVLSWVDITGIPTEDIVPNPNEYTIEVVCTPEVLTAIEADATYTVVSSEDVEESLI